MRKDAQNKLTNILQNKQPKNSDEAGSKQIRQLLQERKKKQTRKDAQNKLTNILQNKLPKKSDDALIKLKFFFFLYKSLLLCSEFNHTSRVKNMSKFNLISPILLPANGDNQEKEGYTFKLMDRDNFYDWYNAYFRVDFKFEATANGGNVVADTESAPINGSFSLIKSLRINSSGKDLYYANNIHKFIFIKNLLEFSDDFSRSVAKDQFWYLDIDATTATDGNATNERKSASITWRKDGSDNNSFKQILLFRRAFRQAVATNAT